MAKPRTPKTLGDQVTLLRGDFLLDVVPPVASTAPKRSATTAVATTAGTTGAAAASFAVITSTLAAIPAAAAALVAPANAATTSLRITPADAFAREERLLGRPGRQPRLFFLGQDGVTGADQMDDLGPVVILHRLWHRLDMSILIRQRANKTRVQEGVRVAHPLLSHLVIRVF